MTIEELKQDVIAVKNNIGKIPTKQEYGMYGRFNPSTIQRRFGSWNNALEHIFNEVNVKSEVEVVTLLCDYCEKKFKRKQNRIGEKNFCSRSCSNMGVKRKKLSKECKSCNTLIKSQYVYCDKCKNIFEEKTLGELKYRTDASRYTQLRENARKIAEVLKNECALCGYDKHVEVCHKKSINSFNDNVKIGEINNIDNLVKLCRNCHWEFDNGLIIL